MIQFNLNNLLIISVIIILIYIVYITLVKPTEKLTLYEDSIKDNKDKLANDIFKFLKSNTEYKDYLDFIVKIPYNLSIKILNQEVFYEMKFLLKNNKLNKNEIKKFLTDM